MSDPALWCFPWQSVVLPLGFALTITCSGYTEWKVWWLGKPQHHYADQHHNISDVPAGETVRTRATAAAWGAHCYLRASEVPEAHLPL